MARDIDYAPASDFLANFFGETTEHAVEIRALPNERGAGRAAPLFGRDGELVQAHLTRWDVPERAVYFGVATRLNGAPSGTRADLAELPALWIDIDVTKIAGLTKEAAVAAARSLSLPPSIIIDSGNGIHCYWLFREAIDVRAGTAAAGTAIGALETEQEIVAALRNLAGVLAGDLNVCDLARIMRLPGSHNTKEGGWRRVEVLEADWSKRYELSDLQDMLDIQRPVIDLPAAAEATGAAVGAEDPFTAYAKLHGLKTPVDVHASLAAMRYGARDATSIHETQLAISASMVARGASDDEIVELLLPATKIAAAQYADHWNWRREEANIRSMSAKWRSEIEVRDAASGKTVPPRSGGAGATVVQLRAGGAQLAAPEIDAEPPPSSTDALIAHFNTRYMVVNEAGKAIVYEPIVDDRTRRRYYWRISFRDFENLYNNLPVVVGRKQNGDPVIKSAGVVWLNHPNRRQYLGGVVFDPTGGERPGALNLWQGFAVEPDDAGSWSLLRTHVHDVICSGNTKHFNFLMGWMARMIQRPAEQGEVAVVLKGVEGTGKGTLARALLRLLGQHGLAISNAKHLVGAFNEHLRDTVFLFADEAFWAGDRAHTGVLKALITEPSLMIEGKFQNATQMPNYVHLMMASNERWVVPAGLESRRFFVLLVSEDRANDHRYFADVWRQMESEGGYAAMLRELLDYDLNQYNPRDVPVTVGLQDQRKLSLPIPEEWWQEALYRGYVFKSKLGMEEYFGQWHDVMSTEVLYDAYLTFARSRGDRYPMAREEFGKFMVRMGARASRPRNIVVGEHVTDTQNSFGGTSRSTKLIIEDRAYGYRLGEMIEARANFVAATRLGVEWPWAGDDDG